jgi:hypothetical protein
LRDARHINALIIRFIAAWIKDALLSTLGCMPQPRNQKLLLLHSIYYSLVHDKIMVYVKIAANAHFRVWRRPSLAL